MGTHPIFESDFDCLTEMLSLLQEGADWLNRYMARWWYVDFHGQFRAERMFQAGAIGWLYGFFTESMQNSMIVLGGGLALSSFLTIPPWWFLRPQEKQLKWSDELDEEDERLYPSWHKKD